MQPGKNAQGHGAGWSTSWVDFAGVEENRTVLPALLNEPGR
jgi:hypothetical protein